MSLNPINTKKINKINKPRVKKGKNMSAQLLQIKPVYKPTLEELVEQYRSIDREHKKLTKIHESIKSKIKESMGENLTVINGLGHEIAQLIVSSRELIDSKQLKLDHPEIASKYTYESLSKSLKLK